MEYDSERAANLETSGDRVGASGPLVDEDDRFVVLERQGDNFRLASPAEVALDLIDTSDVRRRRPSQPTSANPCIEFVSHVPTNLSRYRIRNENLGVELAKQA